MQPKVTIRPEFFGTVPNFEGLSRKKCKVIWDAELSRIPNHVPNLSRFNVKMRCSLTVRADMGSVWTPRRHFSINSVSY